MWATMVGTLWLYHFELWTNLVTKTLFGLIEYSGEYIVTNNKHENLLAMVNPFPRNNLYNKTCITIPWYRNESANGFIFSKCHRKIQYNKIHRHSLLLQFLFYKLYRKWKCLWWRATRMVLISWMLQLHNVTTFTVYYVSAICRNIATFDRHCYICSYTFV